MPSTAPPPHRQTDDPAAERRKIGPFEGIPAMGLDGLGSASYGPEAMLAVLAIAGVAGNDEIQWITWSIILLLGLVFVSYWQTIGAYPHNAGSYAVAKQNLGRPAALLAASALSLDYVLNVCVGISAGVGALISAVPSLHGFALGLSLLILAAITTLNLRGTKPAGLALAVPTYLFIASLVATLASGVGSDWLEPGAPLPAVALPPAEPAASPVTLWLLLRAFAAGCTAMTGIEAVSNSVTTFREPPIRHARRTLAGICLVLTILMLGVAYLADQFDIAAMDESQRGYQSVISQVVASVCGRGWAYDVTIGSVLAVLCLSANTSFVGLPRLCRHLAEDGYLPRAFATSTKRAVHGTGILYLSVAAALLLVAFDGITNRLIPLFAIGAFLSFILNQAGMTVHWYRSTDRWRRLKFALNATGFTATLAVLLIMLVAKFTEGAWLTLVILPGLYLALTWQHARSKHTV